MSCTPSVRIVPSPHVHVACHAVVSDSSRPERMSDSPKRLVAYIGALAAVLGAAPAYAACPNGASTGTTVCSYNATNDVVTCDVDLPGAATAGASLWAVYDPSRTACAQDYCFWGQDATSGANFYYEQSPTGANPMTGLDVLGSSYGDAVYFQDATYGALGPSGSNFRAAFMGYGGDDYALGSTTATAGYTEHFWGGDDDDTFDGDAGVDELFGEGGIDTLSGGAGADTLRGGTEDDFLFGDGNADACYGEGGDDEVSGGSDNDLLLGGSGADVLSGDDGHDSLFGESGQDELFGGLGNDTISGGTESDVVSGAQGNDTINGDEGADDLAGGDDNDTIHGDGDNDDICGDAGNDQLTGDDGDDNLFGANGAGQSENGGAGTDACEGYIGTTIACEAGLGARTCTY